MGPDIPDESGRLQAAGAHGARDSEPGSRPHPSEDPVAQGGPRGSRAGGDRAACARALPCSPWKPQTLLVCKSTAHSVTLSNLPAKLRSVFSYEGSRKRVTSHPWESSPPTTLEFWTGKKLAFLAPGPPEGGSWCFAKVSSNPPACPAPPTPHRPVPLKEATARVQAGSACTPGAQMQAKHCTHSICPSRGKDGPAAPGARACGPVAASAASARLGHQELCPQMPHSWGRSWASACSPDVWAANRPP